MEDLFVSVGQTTIRKQIPQKPKSGPSANVAIGILAICGHYLVSLCEFAICVPKLFCGLKTSASANAYPLPTNALIIL